jgi:hypothetical protein
MHRRWAHKDLSLLHGLPSKDCFTNGANRKLEHHTTATCHDFELLLLLALLMLFGHGGDVRAECRCDGRLLLVREQACPQLLLGDHFLLPAQWCFRDSFRFQFGDALPFHCVTKHDSNNDQLVGGFLWDKDWI